MGVDFPLAYARVWRHAVVNPHVAANHRIVADGDAPQNRCVGVDYHVVLNDGVAGQVEQLALGVVLEIFCSQRHSLIKRHMVAYDTGGTDDYTRAMVDGKIFAYLCGRMDEWASSVMMRGMMGTPSSCSACAVR